MSNYNLGTASGRIEIDGSGASRGFAVAQTAANGFMGVVRTQVADVERFGRRLAIAGASGVAAFGVAIKAASGFENQMSAVRAVTNAGERDFERLREKALQLGADTVFSASEAALAIEELAKAGVPVEDVLTGAADAAVALAAAGGISLPEAATIAANAMNAFGLSAKDVTGVADILAGVANTSAADVSSVGQSLAQAGAVANLAGLSFKDTAIAIGEMANAGINGSDAGTSIKTMLNNLIPVTQTQTNKFKELGLLTYNLKDAQKALFEETGQTGIKTMDGVNKALQQYVEELGKGNKGTWRNQKAVNDLLQKYGGLRNAFFDAKGNIKDLEGLQGTLGKALKGMTKEQKLSTLEVLFGADAMRASAILSLEGAKGYREFAKGVDSTSAAEVAKTRLDNLSGSMEALKGSMETALITIGNVFLPVIQAIVQGATAVVNVFNNLPGPIKTAIAIILGFVSIMAVLIGVLLASLTMIAAFVLQWYALKIIRIATGYLKGFIATQRAGLGIMAAHNAGLAVAEKRTKRFILVQKLAAKAMILFSRAARAAWIALTGPIGIAIAVILALVAVGVLLYKKWEPFRNLVDRIGAAIREGLIAAWAALQPVLMRAWQLIQQFGRYFVSTIMPVLRQVGAVIMGQLIAAFKEIWAVVQSELMPALRDLAATFQSDVAPALSRLWSAAQPILKVLGMIAAVVIGVLFVALKTFVKFMVGTVLPVLIRVGGFIVGVLIKSFVVAAIVIIKAITGIVKAITWIIDAIKGAFSGGGGEGPLAPLVGFFVSAWNTIKSVVTTALSIVSTVILTALKVIFFAWIGIWKLFGPVIKAVFFLILAILKLAWALIKGIVILNAMAIFNTLKFIFTNIWSFIKWVWNAIATAIRNKVNQIRNGLTAAWNAIKAVSAAVWGVIRAVIVSVWAVIGPYVTRAAGRIKSAISTAWNAIKSATSRVWTAISNAVGEKIDAAKKKIETIQEVIGFITGLGQRFFNAGAEIIQKLIDGIASKIGIVTDKINELADKVSSLLPGSPVKVGPLRVLNQGYAGKKIIEMLADGMKDTRPIEKAMRATAAYIAGSTKAMDTVSMVHQFQSPTGPRGTFQMTAGLPPARLPRRAAIKRGSDGKMRLVEGTLRIDKSGRAWIEGIAEEVVEDRKSFDRNRKGGGVRS